MRPETIFQLGELFEQVQLQKIFSDNKTFVDCVPKKDLEAIRERYEAEKIDPEFNLHEFVDKYFTPPPTISSGYKSDTSQSVIEHIEQLWDILTREPSDDLGSLIGLPFPYIVPGGRFREIYYWDSFFTLLGLQVSGRVEMIANMVDNFSFLIDKIGYIPNGNRKYYIGRSQPPFFACMVKLLSEEKGRKILVDYLPQLEKEYNFWMKDSNVLTTENVAVNHSVLMPDGNILNRYWDVHDYPRPEAYQKEVRWAQPVEDEKSLFTHLRSACESGWDFSTRWFKNENQFTSIHTADIIPVDLNCLLLNLEIVLQEANEYSGNKGLAEKYAALARERKDSISKYCWNEEKGFYLDFDFVSSSQTNSMTLAAAFPLYFNIATEEQAEAVAHKLQKEFLMPGGLISTTVTSPEQWDAPNGWAPLQWIAVMGLSNYGHKELAEEIATRWMNINEKVFKNTGKMMEKYNVVSTDLIAGGGEYETQDGFGWTNGVYLALDRWIKTGNVL